MSAEIVQRRSTRHVKNGLGPELASRWQGWATVESICIMLVRQLSRSYVEQAGAGSRSERFHGKLTQITHGQSVGHRSEAGVCPHQLPSPRALTTRRHMAWHRPVLHQFPASLQWWDEASCGSLKLVDSLRFRSRVWNEAILNFRNCRYRHIRTISGLAFGIVIYWTFQMSINRAV